MNAIFSKAKRVISMIIAVSMIMSLLPMTVLAVDAHDPIIVKATIDSAKESYSVNDIIKIFVEVSNPSYDFYQLGNISGALVFNSDKVALQGVRDGDMGNPDIVVGIDDLFGDEIKKGPMFFEQGTGDSANQVLFLMNVYSPQALREGKIGTAVFKVLEEGYVPDFTFKGVTAQEAVSQTATPEEMAAATNYVLVVEGARAIYGEEAAPTYTATFNTGVESLTVEPQEDLASGDTITEPTLTRDGYYLEGWYKEDTYTNKWDFANDKVTEDVTLYARWFEQIAKPTATSTSVVFNGDGQDLPLTGYDSTKMDASGIRGEVVKSYTATFTPKTGYVWSDDNSVTPYEINWSITKAQLTKPTVTGDTEFTHDGTEKSITINGLDETKMTVSGDQKATEVGNYTATVSISDTRDYEWSDGTTTDISFNWSIKAASVTTYTATFNTGVGAPTVEPQENLVSGDTITEPTVTRDGYYLEGWYKEDTFTNKWDFANDKVTEDVTLYARWFEQIAKPTASTTEFEYTGSIIELELANYDENKMNTNGSLMDSDVGNYSVRITPKDGYVWADDNSVSQVTISWKIKKAQLTKPTVTGDTEFTHDGTQKSITIDGFDGTKMTVTGDQTATAVGNYTATVAISDKDHYEWTDETNTDIQFNWSIVAAPVVKHSITVTGGTADKTEAEEGETVTITATVPTGKEFNGWTVSAGGVSLGDASAESTTFTMGTADVTVVAAFVDAPEPPETHTITVTGGTADKTEAEEGELISITATVPTGKVFDGWTVSAGGVTLEDATAESTSFTMGAEDVTVTASFVDAPAQKYTVTVAGGTADKTEAAQGETVTVTATVPTGKVFDGWTVDAGEVTLANENANPTTFVMGTADVEITASFEDEPAETYTVTVTGGTADKDEAEQGETVTITATVPTGKVFAGWTVNAGGVTLANENANPTTFVMGTADVEITASFEDEPAETYTVTVTGGTTDKDEAEEGETVTITATVPTGKVFDSWTVDAGGVTLTDAAAETTTFVMGTADVEVTAEFEDEPANPSGEEPVNPSGEEPVNPSGEEPANPSGEEPVNPSGEEPVNPSGEEPVNPSGEEPVNPSGEEPVNPSGEEPVNPSGEEPVNPSGEEPVEPSGEEPVEPVKPKKTIVLGSSAKTYKISTTAGNGGKITPSNPTVKEGKSQEFTIKPNSGYEIDTIKLDGKEIEPTETVKIDDVSEKHTLEVTFKKASEKGNDEPGTNPGTTTTWSNPFKDVKETDWFYENVKYVLEKGLFKGTNEDHFEPNRNITRGMLVTVLYRYSGATDTTNSTFADVDPSQYYSAPVAWAAKNGYVNGMGDNRFYPDELISRQDMATIIYRYLKSHGEGFTGMWSFLLEYADKDAISEYAYEPVCYMSMSKVLNGKDGNRFDPTGKATRAETAAIFERLAK